MPAYETIQSQRIYEQIALQIEKRILEGELKLGEHLPPERELAEQFGVSRTAVREAGKALAEKGLVQGRPGRGTFVTNGTSQAMRRSLGRMLKIAQPEGARHLVEVREIFEPEIAALAALRASDDQIGAMREAVATMDGPITDREPYIDGHPDF